MSQRPVHFIYERLCSDVTACNTRAKQTPANTTPYDEYVTCPKCLAALGYADQLTQTHGDPLLDARAA